MYRIKLTSGEEVIYKSPEELTTAVQSGVVTPDAHIYHQRANKWLDIAMHPHFRLAQSGWSRSPRPVRPARPVPEPQVPTIEIVKEQVLEVPQARAKVVLPVTTPLMPAIELAIESMKQPGLQAPRGMAKVVPLVTKPMPAIELMKEPGLEAPRGMAKVVPPMSDPATPAIELMAAMPGFEVLKEPVFDILKEPKRSNPLPNSVRVNHRDDGLVLLVPETTAPTRTPVKTQAPAAASAPPRPNLNLRLQSAPASATTPAPKPAAASAPAPAPAPVAKVDLASVSLWDSAPRPAIEIAPAPAPEPPKPVAAEAAPSRALPPVHQATGSKPEPILGLTHETSPLDLMGPGTASMTEPFSRHAERRDSLIRAPRPSVRSKVMTSPELHTPQRVEHRGRTSKLAVAAVVLLLGAGLPLVAWHPWETKAPSVAALLSLTQPPPTPRAQTTAAASLAPGTTHPPAPAPAPVPTAAPAQTAAAPAPAPATPPARVPARPAFGGGPVTPATPEAKPPVPAATAAAPTPAPAPAPTPDSAAVIPAAPSVDLSGSTESQVAGAPAPAPAAHAVAPAITPAQLTHSYAVAYAEAEADLELKMAESGVVLLVGKPKPATADSLESAKQSVAAATTALKNYVVRLQQIEQAYADTLQQVGRTLRLSAEELKAWDFRDTRKEPTEAGQIRQIWQARVDGAAEAVK